MLKLDSLYNLLSPCESNLTEVFISCRERNIKKIVGDIISETELTLLQFYVSWEIIVSWAAANDY